MSIDIYHIDHIISRDLLYKSLLFISHRISCTAKFDIYSIVFKAAFTSFSLERPVQI
jgi:hypothetical protein